MLRYPHLKSLTFLAFFIDAGRLFQVQAPKKVKLLVWLWAICILLSAADLVLWLWTLLVQTNEVSKHWLVLSFKHLYTWTARLNIIRSSKGIQFNSANDHVEWKEDCKFSPTLSLPWNTGFWKHSGPSDVTPPPRQWLATPFTHKHVVVNLEAWPQTWYLEIALIKSL